MLRVASLPSWLGWIGIVIGLLAMTPIGFFAFLASGIWIVLTSVVLLRAPASAR